MLWRQKIHIQACCSVKLSVTDVPGILYIVWGWKGYNISHLFQAYDALFVYCRSGSAAYPACFRHFAGQGNNTVVSVSVCQAGRPGSSPAWSTCFRKVEFHQGAIDLFPLVLTTGATETIHVFLCLCDNACKRSLAIKLYLCVVSVGHSCPVSRLLSVPIWPACAKQGRLYDSNKQTKIKHFAL